MFNYVKRLATTGASYTASSVISKLIAVALLPVYTRYLTPADYGAAELLLASVIVMSILVRFGIMEALLRFYYRFESEEEQARAIRTSFTLLLLTTSAGALLAALVAGPLSELILAKRETDLMYVTIFGLWVFTNYELLLALFRLDERARDYFLASLSNVLLTVALTVWLVVGEGEGAKGLLLGNFLGSAAIYVILFYLQRRRLGLTLDRTILRPMLRFGIPTVPAEVSIFSLNFIDRIIIGRSAGLAATGLYSIAIKFSQIVIVFVRAFNLAWPPLAYSIRDDAEARRAYSLIVTYYVLVCAWVVVGLALTSRWLLRLIVAERFFDAYQAIPYVATGAMLYGLYMVLMVIMGRAGRTEFNFPVTGFAMAANIALNLLLVPSYGIAGAGIALACSYLIMLSLMYALSRRYFKVGFQWLRLAQIVVIAAGLILLAELLLPTAGAVGLTLRLALFALFPLLLYVTGFMSEQERAKLAQLRRRPKSAQPLEDGEALEGGPELVRELHSAQDPD